MSQDLRGNGGSEGVDLGSATGGCLVCLHQSEGSEVTLTPKETRALQHPPTTNYAALSRSQELTYLPTYLPVGKYTRSFHLLIYLLTLRHLTNSCLTIL